MNLVENKQPTLVIIRGLPGGGKSYLAHELQQQIGQDKVVLLDPDEIDENSDDYQVFTAQLTNEGVDAKLHPYRYLRSKGYQGILDGKIIVWNQAFTHQDLLDRTIKNLQAYAQEYDKVLSALVVEVEVDLELAKKRVAERAAAGGHNVDDEAFERFVNDYASFTAYGYPLITLDGAADVQANAAKVKQAIEELI